MDILFQKISIYKSILVQNQNDKFFMKIYLLLIATLLIQVISYRYVGTQQLQLSSAPQNISYWTPNLLVAQDGQTIYIYNTATNTLQQIYKSDSNDPQPQVVRQLNIILFKNNNTLFQIQPDESQTIINEPEAANQWVYPLGFANNTIVYHSLDPVVADRRITYVQYLGPDTYLTQTYEFLNPSENILRGSGVQMLNQNEYYFVSGGICNAEIQVLFLFQGDINGINNVFNLSVPGCNMPNATEKETLGLISVDQGNQNRVHAITYKLEVGFMSTTQIISQSNEVFQQLTRFDTFNLIGIYYTGSKLYTADVQLCRVLQHYPEAYKTSQAYNSVLPFSVTDTAINAQNTQIAVFNGTSTFSIFKYNGGTGRILTQIYKNSPSSATFTDGDYYGNNFWIVRDSRTSRLSTIYLEYTPNKTTADIKDMGYVVVDYCSPQNQVFFSVQRSGNVYTLNQNTINYIGEPSNRTINTSFSVPLPAAVQSIKCLDVSTVLVLPINLGDAITVWKSDGATFSEIGSLIKDNSTINKQIYTAGTSIIFANTSSQYMLVYDFRLTLISNLLQPLLPPGAVYQIVATKANNIIFAVASRGDITQPDTLDHYTLSGSSLTYLGSYPLFGTNQVDFDKIILFSDTNRLSIEYGTRTSIFDINNPPQSLRGYFYDDIAKDCAGYINALFKPSPMPGTYDMLVLNTIDISSIIIQRYSFVQRTTNILSKTASGSQKDYLFSKIQMRFSEDRQKLLIFGIKQTPQTLLYTVQIKNSNNLDTLFEKEYFDIQSKDKVQAFGLYNSQFVSAVTFKTLFNITEFNMLNLIVDNNTLGKISIDSSIVAVDLFSTCTRCSFTAVAAYGSQLIQLLSLITGENQGNITVYCALKQILLSPNGNRIAYLCQNNSLYLYDNVTNQSYQIGINYTQITSFYFLSDSVFILINNRVVVQLKFSLTISSKLTNSSNIIRQSPADVQVQTVAINQNLQIYAYISGPQTVSIFNQQGIRAGLFVLDDSNQNIVGIAFDPLDQLLVATNANNLITLSPSDCPTNFSVNSAGYCSCSPTFVLQNDTCMCPTNTTFNNSGYCSCNPTFALQNDTCMCAAPLYLDGDSCRCEDGSFYLSERQCGECNVMCSTCSGEGVGSCKSYSALFIILIIISVLIVIGLFIYCYIRSKKGKPQQLNQVDQSVQNKKKSESSDMLNEKLVVNKEDKSRSGKSEV